MDLGTGLAIALRSLGAMLIFWFLSPIPWVIRKFMPDSPLKRLLLKEVGGNLRGQRPCASGKSGQ